MIADNDLISIQQARILAENAVNAQKKLATYTQEQLNHIISAIVNEIKKHVQTLAILSHEETDFGKWQDKRAKNHFVCTKVYDAIKNMHCVGVIEENPQQKTIKIGVPIGVIVALSPVTSPVSTTIYKTLLAIKSGNAIIFSPHPRAQKSIKAALDIMIRVGEENGLPKGTLSYLNTVTKSGTLELINHPSSTLVIMSGVPDMYHLARPLSKPIIFGGTGNGPAFIERTANIEQAVKDIIQSKTFDYGITPSAELCLVVDASVSVAVKQMLQKHHAYFMSEDESIKLSQLFFYANGQRRKEMIGKSPQILAMRSGFTVPDNTQLLISERSHVTSHDPYTKELLAPVLGYFVEDDWQNACEKCIELLLHERNAHTLVIHSQNEEVIRQFAMKKPVGRLLVNTPASLGGIGMTTNLTPAMTLGSGVSGYGITTDNVSPLNLVYIRKVGYGVDQPNLETKETSIQENHSSQDLDSLQQFLLKTINILNK